MPGCIQPMSSPMMNTMFGLPPGAGPACRGPPPRAWSPGGGASGGAGSACASPWWSLPAGGGESFVEHAVTLTAPSVASNRSILMLVLLIRRSWGPWTARPDEQAAHHGEVRETDFATRDTQVRNATASASVRALREITRGVRVRRQIAGAGIPPAVRAQQECVPRPEDTEDNSRVE